MVKTFRVVALALAVLSACTPRDSSLDTQPAADSPTLKHLAEAFEGFSPLEVTDLFQSQLKFARAPDPSDLLASFQTLNATRTHRQGTLLSVLTYNVALLNARPFGIPYSVSPELDVRGPLLPDEIMSRHFDIINLQEVWHDEQLQFFKDAAPRNGYRLFAKDRATSTDGLVTLVRESIIQGDPSQESVPYEVNAAREYWPGPKIWRGFLHVTVQHPQAGTLHIYNTHAQAFQENWQNRNLHMRQLGLHARAHSADNNLVILTGDLNGGPYYLDDRWHLADGTTSQHWWNNAVAYPLILYYGDLVDLFAMGTPAQDVTLGKTVINEPHASDKIPGAVEGWCAHTPPVVFTASDCNQLYFKQYAGEEFPARIDHVMAHDPRGRIRVMGAGLEYVTPVDFGSAGTFEWSDHYGVSTSLLIAP